MKTHGEVQIRLQFRSFLTSVLDGGELSVLRPLRFASRERTLGTHWIGSWVILRTCLDAVAKRRNLLSLAGMELRSSSLVALLS